MNWQTILLLTLAILGAALLHARTIPKRRRLFLLLWLIVGVLIFRWANYRSAWGEVAVATTFSLILFSLWWFVLGHKLPTPSDDEIRVWSEDDPF
jgi:hypothetical protein